MAIGAPNRGNLHGHVRVFDLVGSAWVQVGSDIDGEASGEESGYSVALSADGNRVAVGAYANSEASEHAGQVRVYDWDGSSWSQAGDDLNGEGSWNFFGSSVALSSNGNRMAIGAPENDDGGAHAGHVRVYEWYMGNWAKVGADIDGEAAFDYSGGAVSLSADGNRLAVGAFKNGGTGSDAGHVRVYDWSGSSWGQIGPDIDGEAADDHSGISVDLSADGNRLAVGAYANSDNGAEAGHVRVYDWYLGNWAKVGNDIDGEAAGDESGRSVALSADGNRVAVGAPLNEILLIVADHGHARVFELVGSTWTQVGDDIDGESLGDYSGTSVALALNGARIAIGAPYNDGDKADSSVGHVRVFDDLQLLPIELARFDAVAEGTMARLTWETSSESNNSGFEVQMLEEGAHWQALGFVSGHGSSHTPQQYSYSAAGLMPGSHTFRLKQIDFDGHFRYSESIEVAIGMGDSGFLESVYPNPIQSTGHLRFAVPGSGHVNVWVYDMLGRRMKQLFGGEATNGRLQTLEFSTDRLPPGQYLVRLESRGRSLVQPMVVVW